MKDLDAYLTEAIENIREDREVTKELLSDVMQYMSQDQHSHKEVGQTAAKYVETLPPVSYTHLSAHEARHALV